MAADAEKTAAATASDLRAELEDLQAKVATAEAERERQSSAHQAAVEANDGLLARIGALAALEDSDPNLGAAHRLLFLFLTAIECVPVIFKTILSLGRKSQYEWLLDMEEQRMQDRLYLQHEIEYDEAQILAETTRNAARARAATQLDAEVRTARTVLQAQVDLAANAVEQWRDAQTERLADEVSDWLRGRGGDFDAGVSGSE